MYSQSSEILQSRAPPGSDPLSAVLALLRPSAVLSGVHSRAGTWSARYEQQEDFGFCLVIDGQCFIEGDDVAFRFLGAGDFILLSRTRCFTLASDLELEATPEVMQEATPEVRRVAPRSFLQFLHDARQGRETTQWLSGGIGFSRAKAPSFVRLLPSLVHVRRDEPSAHRIRRVIEAIREEVDRDEPGRELLLERFLEVLFVEALRLRPMFRSQRESGLLVGLSDAWVVDALRDIHADVTRRWTVADLASRAGMSRSQFAEHFVSNVGLSPLQYLAEWRMAIARDLLARERLPVAEVAARIGYQSARAFSTAFARVVGCSPGEFTRSVA